MTHTLITSKAGIDILLRIEVACPRCGHVTRWFKSLGGRTYCTNCQPTDRLDGHTVATCEIKGCPACLAWYKDKAADDAIDELWLDGNR